MVTPQRNPPRPAQSPDGEWIDSEPRHCQRTDSSPRLLGFPDLRTGVVAGVPIGLGYLAVSFAFGLFAAAGGMSPLAATLLSLTNVTSAGQFAGTQLFFAGAPFLEIGLTTLLVNLRYMLMSLSLSQKLRPGIGLRARLGIGFGVTDEIFAVASAHPGEPGTAYMAGLITLPVACWTLGTLLGALTGSILPRSLLSALGVALYAMFIAIVTPPARRERPVLLVVVLAAGLSVAGQLVPALRACPPGWRLMICTGIAALAGAILAPVAPLSVPDRAPEARHA